MYKIQIQQKTLWNIKFLFYNNRWMILQLKGLIQLSQIYKNDASITKTRLFKYIENFTTKKMKIFR